MERGKLLLSQDTITMDTAIMEVTDTVIMERERLMLSLATTIMDMVDMVMATMERGKLLLSQDTITMDTAIMEVTDTVTATTERDRLMPRPRLSQRLGTMAATAMPTPPT